MDVTNYRRGTKRKQSNPRRFRYPLQRVPRTLRYTGETSFTRTANVSIAVTSGLGFTIGASAHEALAFTFDPTGVTWYGSSVSFASIPLPNAAEIAALWDMISIDKVEMTITSLYDPSDAGGTTNFAPRMLICNDYNSGVTGTSLSAIQEHSDCKTLNRMNNKWAVKPKYQRVVYFTAVSSSYEPARGFVNADSAIPHYGTHIGIIERPLVQGGRVNFSFKFFMRAKNVK